MFGAQKSLPFLPPLLSKGRAGRGNVHPALKIARMVEWYPPATQAKQACLAGIAGGDTQ